MKKIISILAVIAIIIGIVVITKNPEIKTNIEWKDEEVVGVVYLGNSKNTLIEDANDYIKAYFPNETEEFYQSIEQIDFYKDKKTYEDKYLIIPRYKNTFSAIYPLSYDVSRPNENEEIYTPIIGDIVAEIINKPFIVSCSNDFENEVLIKVDVEGHKYSFTLNKNEMYGSYVQKLSIYD